MFHEFEDSDIEKNSHDTTPFTCVPDADTITFKLQSTSDKLLTWSKNNYMKAKPEKCHLLLSLETPTQSFLGGFSIQSSTKETLLGVLIDFELRFDGHISLICIQVDRKLNPLGRTANFMSYDKRAVIMKAFIESHFNYCTGYSVPKPFATNHFSR